eukprot:2774872-Amphidinium_carterae.1
MPAKPCASVQLQRYLLSQNLFTGAIPEGCSCGQVATAGMNHEGSVPSSFARLTAIPKLRTMLVFGHGLRGTWPSVPSTLAVISAWANLLEGHLPELLLDSTSTIFVQSNYLS